ncbi:hypothetical protein A2415_04090 [candidate division WWE3 bacterium RIFOXYC1_FULL_39_7]|uniref:O-antigen ligase-related domain-containing protein n=2 Tax=Katanobacteria TaxID=422282 RepID=A0A1F4X9A2_UNCKA|nr:MAG: hypothetical protein A2415_04090 [candidate division WWE3 bacterium RIFOXYC1_FULL_39_7]OGC77633.1 MAG: hypothetical protein A2619_05340 [candidate division WWE3 bacterium RIFOXYD1_FULL_39_9]
MKDLKILQNVISNRYFYSFAFLFFFTPLIFSRSTNELFEFPKMFFVYIIGVLILGMFVLEKFLSNSKPKSMSLIPLLFLASFIVSTLLSSHLYTSVWGYYTRFNDGLLSVLICAAMYLIAKDTLSTDQLDKIFKISIVSLIPIGLLGVSQHFGLRFLWGGPAVDRVFSTFGQPNWMAQYIVLLLPLCVYYFVTSSTSWNRTVLWFFSAVFGFAGLWFSYSVSGVLSFIICLPVFSLLFMRGLIQEKKSFIKFLLLSFIFACTAIFNPGIFKDKVMDLQRDVQRFISQNITVYAQDTPDTNVYKVSDPGFIRYGLWKGTLELITSSPKVFLIGKGPETFPYEFQQYRSLDINYSSEWNFVMNKPHNYYLEIWAETGIVGLAIYLIWCIYLLLKLPPKYRPGLIGFLVTNIFGWPTVAVNLLFWLMLARAETKI